MARQAPRFSHLHPVVRGARLHGRLLISFLVGLVALALLPDAWLVVSRLLCAWLVVATLYLVLTARLVVRSSVARLRQRAAEDDEGAAFIIALAALASLASVGAIFVELSAAKTMPETMWLRTTVGVLTIVLSWFFIHVIFAQHYAHKYYEEDGKGGGLSFPGDDEPDYWDFMYFSFVIGMTSQVSDVEITNRTVRRTATVHGVLAFIFNTSILALTINVAGNVV